MRWGVWVGAGRVRGGRIFTIYFRVSICLYVCLSCSKYNNEEEEKKEGEREKRNDLCKYNINFLLFIFPSSRFVVVIVEFNV
jgi:hypothetical protein